MSSNSDKRSNETSDSSPPQAEQNATPPTAVADAPPGDASPQKQAQHLPADAHEEAPLTPEEFAEEVHWHDMLLVLLVLLLGVMLSYSRVSNYDLWKHVRTGAYIAEHGAVPRTDILSYTAEDRRWVNLNWLFALASHQIRSIAGFNGLVLVKMVSVALLTLLLLSIRHRSTTMWWGVCATAACLVILNREFLVQPEMFTYVGLAAQLAIVHQAISRDRKWMLALLVPLQVLWVNVDERFYVGLLTLLLVLVGTVLDELFRPKKTGERRRAGPLALVFVLSAAACFLNPYDLSNPTSLSAVKAPLLQHTDFTLGLAVFRIPLPTLYSADFWSAETHSWQEIGTGLVVLLALLMFGMNWRRFRWSRFLVFLGFLALGTGLLQHANALVLVACVTLALNGQEWFRDRFGTAPRIEVGWLIWSRGGRIVTVLSIVTLFVVAASGRLRGTFGNDLGLGVADELLDTFKSTRDQLAGIPEDARGFNFDKLLNEADMLIAHNYPSPVRKVFLDKRLALFRQGRAGENDTTQVALEQLPAEVVLPAAGTDDTPLYHTLARLPTQAQDIPLAYENRFWYDSAGERLVLRGRISQVEFDELLDLVSPVVESLLPEPAVDGQGQEGRSGVARRSYHKAVRALYARSRAAYNAQTRTLSFRGSMSPDDYAVLLSQSDDGDYRQAVNALFDQTQDLLHTYARLREVIFQDDADVWKPLFDKYHIEYLTLHLGPPSAAFYSTFARLLQSPNWAAVAPLSGSLALFVREDTKNAPLAEYRDQYRLDFQKLAYQVKSDDLPEPVPAVSVEPRTWYFDMLWRTRYAASEELLEAMHYAELSELLNPNVSEMAAFPLLTIRRSRESLLDNPGNPNAYLMLAASYQELLRLEWQVLPHPAVLGTRPTRLDQHHLVRYYQLIAALNQALAADPDLGEAHNMLKDWYIQRGHWDLAIYHYRRLHELATPDNALTREQEIAVLEKRVEDMREALRTRFADRPSQIRAQLALENGFPQLAMEELGGFSPVSLDSSSLYVRLCFETGQHEKAFSALQQMEELPELADGRWEELMGTVRLLQGNYVEAIRLWDIALQKKQFAAAADFIRGSGLLMLGTQRKKEDPPGMWQGYGLPMVFASAELAGRIPLERSTVQMLQGMAYLETPYVDLATAPLSKALATEPNNPVRAVITYFLEKLTDEHVDPFAPVDYVSPEFEAEPDARPDAAAGASAP